MPSSAIAGVTPRRGVVALALACVWVIWGSTYLGIKIGLETMPPFQMQGMRFVAASAMLGALARRRGAPWPSRRETLHASIVGLLLLIGGLGMVTLAEDRGVETGLVATLIAVQPLLMAVWGGIWGTWPRRREWFGMGIGLVGVLVLMADSGLAGTWSGVALVLVACLSWSFGSTLSRHLRLPAGPMASAVEMAAAAIAFVLLSVVTGEHVTRPSGRSVVALVYLVVFGSVIAFSAFTYLIASVRPSLAMSYAFVNPLIAVLLGALFADERTSTNLVVSLPLILVGVAVVTRAAGDSTPGGTPASPTLDGQPGPVEHSTTSGEVRQT